jgi:hypothetical protein
MGDAEIGDFLDAVYDNLFNRAPDAGGLACWTGQIKQTLAAGEFVGSVLINIIGGAQNSAVGQDVAALMSKVAVSLSYLETDPGLIVPGLPMPTRLQRRVICRGGFLILLPSFAATERTRLQSSPVLRGRCPRRGRRGKATSETHEIPTSESDVSRVWLSPSAPYDGAPPPITGEGFEICPLLL